MDKFKKVLAFIVDAVSAVILIEKLIILTHQLIG